MLILEKSFKPETDKKMQLVLLKRSAVVNTSRGVKRIVKCSGIIIPSSP